MSPLADSEVKAEIENDAVKTSNFTSGRHHVSAAVAVTACARPCVCACANNTFNKSITRARKEQFLELQTQIQNNI